MTGDGGVLKCITTPGDESDNEFPKEGDEIRAHYTGTLASDGSEFDSSRSRGQEFKFTLGAGMVIKGWDVGFGSMKRGERAVLTLTADYAYGANGSPPKIPPNATLKFDVELLGFGPKPKEKWELSSEEKLEEATKLKDEANELFRAKDFDQANSKYEEAASYCDNAQYEKDEELKKALTSMGQTCKLNHAQSSIMAKDYSKAIALCSEVLKDDPVNFKALLRRGTAFSSIGKLADAKQDLLKCRTEHKDQDQSAVNKQIKLLHSRVQASKEKEKQSFAGIFGSEATSKGVSLYDDKPMTSVMIPHDKHRDSKYVFMDIQIGNDQPAQRVEFELFYDSTPRTAENFRSLCAGDNSNKLSYKGCTFHRIIKGFMCQGGDFENGDGTGGSSIYGSKFEDESFSSKHTEPFLLSMANAGKDTNGSQFFVTTAETSHLDGKHVVFGRVVNGQDVVRAMEDTETGSNDKPVQDVVIVDCGEMPVPSE